MVLVATVRALKMHGGGEKSITGKPFDSGEPVHSYYILNSPQILVFLSLQMVSPKIWTWSKKDFAT